MIAARAAGLVFAVSLLACPAAWASCSPPQPVRFPAGADATELTGGIPRGARDCYTLRAHAGQRLSVTQQQPIDDNVVLQLYRPPWRVAQGANGSVVIGKALPGAAETQDARQWSGRLPVGGEYLLVLGTTRGGAEYRVRLRVQ